MLTRFNRPSISLYDRCALLSPEGIDNPKKLFILDLPFGSEIYDFSVAYSSGTKTLKQRGDGERPALLYDFDY